MNTNYDGIYEGIVSFYVLYFSDRKWTEYFQNEKVSAAKQVLGMYKQTS